MSQIKIMTIIGARPQIIKAAALSRAIKQDFSDRITEIIVHTGQHYDANMSQVFFDELGIPAPHYNLGVGSGSHGTQTARMIEGIEELLLTEKPRYLVLYGDTNSTLAGAVAASKIHVPIVHIEAGLRSFNKQMPEEINRIMCDHASTLLFSPTRAGIANLIREGFRENAPKPYSADNPAIFHCGDIMYDNSLHFAEMAEQSSDVLEVNGLSPEKYILATIHRNNNTDDPERLSAIFGALNTLTRETGLQVILPLHPRTSKLLEKNLAPARFTEISENRAFRIVPPVSFLDMTRLEKNATLVLTDSGGVQKEAYFFRKPCVIARSETEWMELVESGSAIVADADEQKLVESATFLLDKAASLQYPAVFGDGSAARFMCRTMIENA